MSLQSAASVINSIDPQKYEIVPVAITHEGNWLVGKDSLAVIGTEHVQDAPLLSQERETALTVQNGGLSVAVLQEVDVVFPVLHGTYGEDGTIQGLLEMAGIPYVGAGVLASAVGMDKVMMKQIFAQAGLPQGDFASFLRRQWESDPAQVIEHVEAQFTYPCFVKPANLGSSVGISKVKDRQDLREALIHAYQFDRKVIVEEFIPAREVEVAVLGNDEPKASIPGEIVASNEFYDYRAKYMDGKSVIKIPADLPQATTAQIQNQAIEAFKAIDGSGLARVDFFVRSHNHDILINEINTMPGFTQYSMYAKLWEHTGFAYSDLVDRLLDLAFERYDDRAKNLTKWQISAD